MWNGEIAFVKGDKKIDFYDLKKKKELPSVEIEKHKDVRYHN